MLEILVIVSFIVFVIAMASVKRSVALLNTLAVVFAIMQLAAFITAIVNLAV